MTGHHFSRLRRFIETGHKHAHRLHEVFYFRIFLQALFQLFSHVFTCTGQLLVAKGIHAGTGIGYKIPGCIADSLCCHDYIGSGAHIALPDPSNIEILHVLI
ncbi:hypothetical protein ES707_08637 [subsurface metagenome]